LRAKNGKKSAHFEELKKNSKMSETNLKTTAYFGKSCLLATMHDKQKAISPSFSKILKLQIEVAKIDTDKLGTFTGEIERKASALDCARKKCELAMNKTSFTIAIASEGSFGPHPFIPFIACDHEILYFIDREIGFHLHQSLLSSKTNYCMEAISNSKRLKEFADQVLFPSHGLIVRPNKSHGNLMIFKGIQSFDKLEEAFIKCCKASVDDLASVETDMRAHMNPTRMEVIKELADSLALRLATKCPSCYTPGWGIIGNKKGLECEMCGFETEMVRSEIFGCAKCDYKETLSRQDGLTKSEAQYCPLCNP